MLSWPYSPCYLHEHERETISLGFTHCFCVCHVKYTELVNCNLEMGKSFGSKNLMDLGQFVQNLPEHGLIAPHTENSWRV